MDAAHPGTALRGRWKDAFPGTASRRLAGPASVKAMNDAAKAMNEAPSSGAGPAPTHSCCSVLLRCAPRASPQPQNMAHKQGSVAQATPLGQISLPCSPLWYDNRRHGQFSCLRSPYGASVSAPSALGSSSRLDRWLCQRRHHPPPPHHHHHCHHPPLVHHRRPPPHHDRQTVTIPYHHHPTPPTPLPDDTGDFLTSPGSADTLLGTVADLADKDVTRRPRPRHVPEVSSTSTSPCMAHLFPGV